MKADKTTKLYKKVFKITENHQNINKLVKGVFVNFGDERGDIFIENDNFKTRRKYADFTNGKKSAGLNPFQIVFAGVDLAAACHDKFLGADDKIHDFAEIYKKEEA